MNFNKIYMHRYSSWKELEIAIESINNPKEKGTAFEQFVFAYFTFFKEIYLISELYTEHTIPSNLRQKIKLEKRDSGVDGVYIKDNGEIVAYQAKFRSNHLPPTYDDLTSFWSESEHADVRCIFANCYELPQQAYKKKDQFFILRNELNSLESNFFDWLNIYSITGMSNKYIEKYKPMQHQLEMISDVILGFKTEQRGKMLAACGTGKTLTALWIKEELDAKNVLFVAPNLALIKQTLEAWMPQAKESFSYLCVCSDPSVADNSKINIDDEFQTDPSFIGVPVTTDSNKIAEFLKFDTKKDKILFSTYQSLDAVVSGVDKFGGFEFDISFFDEAHRTAGNKNTQMFILGMNDTFVPSKKRLFMTATERFVNPRIIGRAKEYNYEVFSMDNYEQYGSTFTSLPFRTAIEKEIISDYKIVLCCMKEGELKNIIDNNLVLNVGDKEVDSQNLFKQVLLAKTMNDIGIHKVISYHRDIIAAKRFITSTNGTNLDDVISSVMTEILPSDIYSNHINGTMSAGNRKEIFDEFILYPYSVISNARCLTEGVDVPVIDAVYFADPKNSIIDIIQAVGRSLRKVKENPDKISYIIIPLIISDQIANFEDIEPEKFSTLHTVIQALRDQDRILADYIDKLNLKLAKGEKPETSTLGETPIIIEASKQLNIEDVASKILLRVAEVNKDPINISREFIFEPKARTAGVERGEFVSIGDYNLESYWGSCIFNTLKKYDSKDVGLSRIAITIDHNNVSHAVKIGALIEKEKKYYLTKIGKMFYDFQLFEQAITVLQEQLLKFYRLSTTARIPQFPYRYALKVLAKVNKISKFEFAYAMFIAKDLSDRGVEDTCNRISYLRETYPSIESLSESNKEIVLAALNEKFDTTFKIIDIWTSRTTLHNQYNYLKKHLSIWGNVIDKTSLNIMVGESGILTIYNLLDKTKEIETCPMDKLNVYFLEYKNWLNN